MEDVDNDMTPRQLIILSGNIFKEFFLFIVLIGAVFFSLPTVGHVRHDLSRTLRAAHIFCMFLCQRKATQTWRTYLMLIRHERGVRLQIQRRVPSISKTQYCNRVSRLPDTFLAGKDEPSTRSKSDALLALFRRNCEPALKLGR
jgi:hypothetical protein